MIFGYEIICGCRTNYDTEDRQLCFYGSKEQAEKFAKNLNAVLSDVEYKYAWDEISLSQAADLLADEFKLVDPQIKETVMSPQVEWPKYWVVPLELDLEDA